MNTICCSAVKKYAAYSSMLKYAILAGLSVLISSLHCCFSPLSEVVGHPDPACFYMVGKAWTYGFVPYVDAIDIKGPLLFLFFAVGYLIHGTFGVWMLLTLCFTFTVVGVYRIAQLFTRSDAYSILVVCVFLLFYLRVLPSDGRTEDIILPLLVWSIYSCLMVVLNPGDLGKFLWTAKILGVSTAVVMLMKYNAVLPLVCCAGCMIVYAIKHHYDAGIIIKFILVGLLYFVALISFVAVFLGMQNALLPCIDVYFNVSKAVGMCWAFSGDLRTCLMLGGICCLFSCSVGIGVWLCAKTGEYVEKKWVTALWCVYAAGAFLACIRGNYYYYIICFPFLIYPSVGLIFVMKESFPFFKRYVRLISLVLICAAIAPDLSDSINRILKSEECVFDQLIDSFNVKNPRVLYLELLDMGLGVRCDSLPACPYWMTLNRDVFSAIGIQKRCVEARIPDFVITRKNCSFNDRIEKCGYINIAHDTIAGRELCLWKKK